jgi:hypothetical protein
VLSNEQKDQIVILKKTEHKNNTEISRLLGIDRGTVIKVLKSGWQVNQQFIDTINENRQIENNNLLEKIKSIRYNDIVTDVLSLFTKKNMEKELDVRGMRSLIALQGNMLDKGMAYERLELEKRKVDIAERMLELKEEELEARINNPDAFATVQIINDAPKEEEENIYGSN